MTDPHYFIASPIKPCQKMPLKIKFIKVDDEGIQKVPELYFGDFRIYWSMGRRLISLFSHTYENIPVVFLFCYFLIAESALVL